MVEGDYFDKLEAVARAVRRSKEPFGGIQLVLCGDFLQLPPVSKGREKKNYCFQVREKENKMLLHAISNFVKLKIFTQILTCPLYFTRQRVGSSASLTV